ncbi:hypothetical protein [Streptomyces sp. NPDC048350]|uniref:hypothetical protein n=1 Tax=Streptomyces sp. NPDC048350 TaxID=3365538 RepID=UPI00371344BA
MSITDPNLLDHAFEAALGRRAPFTMVGDWVLLCGASTDARTLYWSLSSHINVTRDDTEVWPGLVTLARLLQLKKPEQVARYMLELEVIGAVDVMRSQAGLVRRNRYVIHQTPPAGYSGAQSLGQWYGLNRPSQQSGEAETQEQRKEREAQFDAWLEAVRMGLKAHCERVSESRKQARKARLPEPPVVLFRPPRIEDFRTPPGGGTARPAEMHESDAHETKTAGQPVPPSTGVRTPVEGGPVPPWKGVEQDEEKQDQEQQDGRAPAARRVADGRRPSTGSSARGTGGNAAPGGAEAPRKSSGSGMKNKATVRMTTEQAAAVRLVEAAFPTELRSALPQYRPPVLRDAILDALRWRSAVQLAERVDRRWFAWGFARKADTAAGGEGLSSPVGVAVKLVGDGDCRAARCEDGVDLDTGLACPRCEERLAERKRRGTVRRIADVPRQHPVHQELPIAVAHCEDCGVGMIWETEDGLCAPCRTLQSEPSLGGPAAQPLASATCEGLDGTACGRPPVVDGLCRRCLAAHLQRMPAEA